MMQNGIYSMSDAKIIFRNFRGEARQYNKEGDRNFNIILTTQQAEECANIGFNVKATRPRHEDDDVQLLLPVAVSFKYRPPKITQITSVNQVLLNEDTVGELDYADIAYIDLTIRPYKWTRPNGDSGVKAYLNSMYVTLVEDVFASKYADSHTSDDDLPFDL